MGCGSSKIEDVAVREPDMGKRVSKTEPEPVDDSIPVPPMTPPNPNPDNLLDMMCIGLKRFCDVIDKTRFTEEGLRKFVEFNMESIEELHFTSREKIYEKGSQPEGLYIVASGEACVLSEHRLPGDSDYIELMRVPQKDFFCDVEIVYGMPCTTSVRSHKDSIIYKIPPECVHALLEKSNGKKPDLATWYVRRRYPPNIPNVNHKKIYERISMSVMGQVTLFSRWSPAVLEYFLDYMPKQPIILYPTGANILKAGDSGEYMILLIRGRLKLKNEDRVTVGFVHQNYTHTRLFGEEGIFSPDWSHTLSVVADTPCHVLQVEKDWLWHASDNIWEFAEGAEPHWSNAVKKWQRIHSLYRKGDMYQPKSTYGPFLQIEVQYHWLRSDPSFAACPPGFVYEVAKCGQGMLVKKDKFFSYDDLVKGCILVLKGELHLVTKSDLSEAGSNTDLALDVYPAQSLIYYQDMGEDDLFLFAIRECLMIKFSKQDLNNELKNFPEASLDFMQISDV